MKINKMAQCSILHIPSGASYPIESKSYYHFVKDWLKGFWRYYKWKERTRREQEAKKA